MSIWKKTKSDLEWHKLLKEIASRASSELASRRIFELPFFEAEDDAFNYMALVHEWMVCIDDDDNPPRLDAVDPASAFAHLASDGLVPPEEFMAVAHNLRLYVALHRYLENRKDRCPLNEALVVTADVQPVAFSRLVAEIDGTFEGDGTVKDDASPELMRLKKRLNSLRQNLLDKLQTIADENEDVLRDKTVTLRNNRYVLPFRSDAHRAVRGIVHGVSQTGATNFVEPESCVQAGNDLTIAKEEILREEHRILERLKAQVQEQQSEVSFACGVIVEAEERIAKARFCWDVDATIPQKGTQMVLKGARHPLLCLQLKKVVANDVTVEPSQTILISGPNAGGKTVVLKTVGVLSLMLRAGLPIPAEPESTVFMPGSVFSDMKDEQSIEMSLSTFSGHMKNIGEVFNGLEPGAIVLLDELCSGTDPVEGAALAEAILDALNSRGVCTLATTHYDTLKDYAQSSDGYANAGMGFNEDTQAPTYRLKLGMPGSSSAFATARKYNVPAAVVDSAKQRLPEGVRQLTAAVEAMEREQRRLAQEQDALRQAKEEAESVAAKHKEKLKSLQNTQQRFVDAEAKKLWESIKRARKTVREQEQSIKRKTNIDKVRKARSKINEIANDVIPGGELDGGGKPLPGRPARVADAKPGQSVYVVSMKQEATIDAEPRGNTVYVKAGLLKLRVTVDDLRVISKQKVKDNNVDVMRHRRRFDAGKPTGDAVRTAGNTIDVRGMRVDDAMVAIERYFDEAMGRQEDVVYVLTGYGTGQLCDGVRRKLKGSPYVSDFRPGDEDEGGDAVTAVFLR